jgi:hypothetical protein
MSLTKTIAIVQSSYIPWKGYFDLIRAVDEFVLLDDVQFTRRDWRSRNRIKTPQGLRWLTVPVEVSGRYTQRIDEARVADRHWAEQHWSALRHAYGRAPCFREVGSVFERVYEELAGVEHLSLVNRRLIEVVCCALDIRTPLSWSTDYASDAGRNDRLLSICRAAGASTYLSGPSARAYLDVGRFEAAGVSVRFVDYAGYPEYPQIHGPFEHAVTVLDLLFHLGERAPSYLRALS